MNAQEIRARLNGALCRKIHDAQIACDGIPFRKANPYSRKHLREAWERGWRADQGKTWRNQK